MICNKISKVHFRSFESEVEDSYYENSASSTQGPKSNIHNPVSRVQHSEEFNIKYMHQIYGT